MLKMSSIHVAITCGWREEVSIAKKSTLHLAKLTLWVLLLVGSFRDTSHTPTIIVHTHKLYTFCNQL